MSRDKLVDVNDPNACMGCQGKSGFGKIHEEILVYKHNLHGLLL